MPSPPAPPVVAPAAPRAVRAEGLGHPRDHPARTLRVASGGTVSSQTLFSRYYLPGDGRVASGRSGIRDQPGFSLCLPRSRAAAGRLVGTLAQLLAPAAQNPRVV